MKLTQDYTSREKGFILDKNLYWPWGDVMAITVRKLFKNATILYQMKLIGGKEGLDNLVQWVHIIEDNDVSKFLHGQELVFTAGILNNESDWLLQFARSLYQAGTSAFVVNIGPYTKRISQEVIDFCDKVKMPLFTIPWEIRMVDMTRDFCYRIMKNDTVEGSMSTTIKNIIFGIGDMETQIQYMERYGYQRESRFCFVAISLKKEKEIEVKSQEKQLKFYAERIARSIQELYIAFLYNDMLILVLVDYSIYEVENFIEKYIKTTGAEKPKWKLYIGASPNTKGIGSQKENFSKAIEALDMARRKNEKVIYYEKLGIYKLLLSVSDKGILKEFYDSTIGKLEYYDQENKASLKEFLRIYLENNGSPQLVSEKQYIHRNTVNNQLKKIEKITGYDPLDLEDKVQLFLAFYIQDVL